MTKNDKLFSRLKFNDFQSFSLSKQYFDEAISINKEISEIFDKAKEMYKLKEINDITVNFLRVPIQDYSQNVFEDKETNPGIPIQNPKPNPYSTLSLIAKSTSKSSSKYEFLKTKIINSISTKGKNLVFPTKREEKVVYYKSDYVKKLLNFKNSMKQIKSKYQLPLTERNSLYNSSFKEELESSKDQILKKMKPVNQLESTINSFNKPGSLSKSMKKQKTFMKLRDGKNEMDESNLVLPVIKKKKLVKSNSVVL